MNNNENVNCFKAMTITTKSRIYKTGTEFFKHSSLIEKEVPRNRNFLHLDPGNPAVILAG